MKKVYIFTITAAVSVAFLSFQRTGNLSIEKYFAKNDHKNSSGAGSGRTGAPGETNCTACHAGTALDGANENTLIVANGFTPISSYTPGVTYNVALTMNSQPAKKGFQAIALTSGGAMAGTFISGTNTAVTASGTKRYANHTDLSNTNSTTAWLWQWTAPATNVGSVTFYVATNKTNNNGTTSGDAIYLSQHVINAGSAVGIEEVAQDFSFKAAFSPSSNSLTLDFNSLSSGDVTLNLVDLSGRSVFYQEMGQSIIGENHHNITLPAQLKNGIYVVNLFVNNKAMSDKIMIQK